MNPETQLPSVRSWADWRGWPYLLIGIAVLLRVVHIWNSRSNPTFWAPAVDPEWYDQYAQDILQGNWGPFPLFRAPLYPALLAATYGIFGRDLVAARLLNVFFQGITIWIIWRVGRSYFSSAVGIVAALLFAFNGMAIFYADELLSVSAEILASAVVLWATLRLTRDISPPTLILCGIAWGLAVITRPNYLFLFPVVVVVLWVFSKRNLHRQGTPPLDILLQRLTPIVIWGFAAFAPILPVTAANWILGGEPVLVATQGGINFWIGNNPESTGILSVLPGYGNAWTMENAQNAAEAEVGHPLKPGQLSSYYYAKGWSYLFSHPERSLRFMIRKTMLFFNRFEISNNKHIGYFSALTPWLPPLIYLGFGVLIPLTLLGCWSLWSRPAVKIIALLIALYAFSVILFFVTSRFRMPAVPWMAVLSAGGVVWAVESVRSRVKLRRFLPLTILIPGVVIAWMNPWHMEEAPVGWARYMEGNAYLKLEQLDSARVCFMDALRDGMTPSKSELNLGVIAAKQGNTAEARNWYLAALREDSANTDAWNNLGTTCETLRDTASALEAYRHALAISPSAPDPRHNLAGVYFRQGVAALKRGDDVAAIQQLESCTELEPSAITYYDLAIAYGRNGLTNRALDRLDHALTLDPHYTPAMQLKERLSSGNATFPKAAGVPSDRDSVVRR